MLCDNKDFDGVDDYVDVHGDEGGDADSKTPDSLTEKVLHFADIGGVSGDGCRGEGPGPTPFCCPELEIG